MTQARFRQIARLEKLATPYINRRREGETHILEVMREEAFRYVANLSLLILYGNPKTDEPLLNAWDRVRKSAAWQECRNNHPNFAEYGREDQGDFCEHGCKDQTDFGEGECEDQKDFSEYHGTKYFDGLSGMYIATPFDSLGVMYIAKYFRSYFIPDLPGADETEKLNAIFEKAPLWLLWFTHGDVYGSILGLKLPDFTSARRFARREFKWFGGLPEGPFDWRPLPQGETDKVYASEKHMDVSNMGDMAEMTPRQRKRALKIFGSGE